MFNSHRIVPNVLSALFVAAMFSSPAQAQSDTELEGFTSAYRDVQVGSPDTSTITGLRVDVGESVRHGDVLVQLDDSVLRAAVDVAREAALAKGDLEAAKQLLAAKERRLKQTQELHDRGHATLQECEAAETERDEAAARVQAHQELIARRERELRRVETELARMTIRSPLDGIVVELFRDIGEVVSPADPRLVRVVQLDPLKVVATGPAKHVRPLKAGDELLVNIDGESHRATIEYVSPMIDAQSGMGMVHLRLPNPQQRVPSGVPCRVLLERQPPTKTRSAARASAVPLPSTIFHSIR